MKYYSTNRSAAEVSLGEAVIEGLAPDKGLYMPERINLLPTSFFENLHSMSLQEASYEVASALFGEDVDSRELKQIVFDTMNFNIPLVEVKEGIYSLELFHGPTAAFKDVGGRFMARMLGHFIGKQKHKKVTVLVATSGDTGSAVANGFLGVPGIDVVVLYPKGLVSEIQEKQFTTLGQNITAIEINGTFDNCQALVKSAFMDTELKKKLNLTSANSINVARFLPQSFYYFYAFGQIVKRHMDKGINKSIYDYDVVFSVPSGNFGNLCAGLFAKKMGLPVKRFIAANNSNDIVYKYLKTGQFTPAPSIATIANAMDVGDPSNFARIMDLYDNSHSSICNDISGATYSDEEISESLLELKKGASYLADPHGACGYRALKENLKEGELGIFLETAHPAKFKDTVEQITGETPKVPERLKAFMGREKMSIPMSKDYESFRRFLESKL